MLRDLILIIVGLLVAGGPLLACIVFRLRNRRWPGGRWVAILCYVWGLIVGELLSRLGLQSPLAFLMWFAVFPVLLLWLIATPARQGSK